MLDPLTQLLTDNTPVTSPWGRILVIGLLFLSAWVVARVSGFLARRVLAWQDGRHKDVRSDETGEITNVKRRETLVSFVRAAIAYAGFTAAAVLSIAQLLGGVDRLAALAGASFVLVVAGFAAQRLLTDMLAGLTMFLERWYSVGDTIAIATLDLQGVVEDVSLRHTKLRTLDGEAIHVHNSQIPAVRVLPRGAKELAMELFVTDRKRGEDVVAAVSAILPHGSTTFVRRPWVDRIDDLSEMLVRLRVLATVAPGREWLVQDFFSQLLKEQAGDGLIAHGPVVLAVDERASRSFARASAATRWSSALAA
ncbi:MAG: mechanosensitive ion channel family protein [Actinomycetota bacterium]|nr:mechanosensitive ion channel family protein [Actinomycetota bacterium]